MEIAYGKDTVRVRQSLVAIGLAAFLLAALLLGWLVYDFAVFGSNLWGTDTLGLLVVCFVASGYTSTCYRTILIDRATRKVTVDYRGLFGYKDRHSYFSRTSHVLDLSSFRRVAIVKKMEYVQKRGELPFYYLMLEADPGESVSVYLHSSQAVVKEAAKKLAAFLSLPVRSKG